MIKNQANQRVEIFAFDYATGQPKTGIAANLAIYVQKDFAALAALGNTTVSEVNAANAPGVYLSGLMTQAESNADHLMFSANCAVANVATIPRFIDTVPIRFTSQVIDANGAANANVSVVNGHALGGSNGTVPELGIVWYGTGQAAGAANFTIDAGSPFANSVLSGCVLEVTGSTQGYAQHRQILDNASANKVLTVDPPWTVTPSGTLAFIVYASTPAAGNSPAPVNVTQFGGVAGTFTGGRPEVSNMTGNVSGNVGGNVAGNVVGNVQGNVAGTVTGANMAAVPTNLGLVLAQTNKLQFNGANAVQSNISHVIGEAVQNNGSTTTNWGGPP